MIAIQKLRIAVSALLLSGLADTALADGSLNTPGSACVATGTNSLFVRSDGEVENLTASIVTVVCPVDRPIGPGVTTTILSGDVFVIDQHPTLNVCCRVMSKNPSGSLVPGTQDCSAATSASYQHLVLPAITDEPTFSQFFVQCTVPPVSAGIPSRIQMVRNTQQ